jgi:hypothetical protein
MDATNGASAAERGRAEAKTGRGAHQDIGFEIETGHRTASPLAAGRV